MRRAAIYVRVSSDVQTTANQVPDLEALAARRGLEIVVRYDETGSAAKRRPKFDAMLADAKKHRFDVLLVWSLDRFGRSMSGNLAAIVELDRIGVEVVSVREAWLDTSGPVRSLLIAIFSWVAEQERARLIERTNAGLARARREGKRLGRPVVRFDLGAARALQTAGVSIRDVAAALNVSKSTLARELARSAVPKTPTVAPSDSPSIATSPAVRRRVP